MYDIRKRQFLDKLAVLEGEIESAVQAAKRGDTDEAMIVLEQAEVRSRAIRGWVEIAARSDERVG